jgi:hypothetical protein
MHGPLFSATSSIPPSSNQAFQSNAASSRDEEIGPDALQLSDRTRLHLEKAASWGAADGVSDALQSVANIKLAPASPAITRWEDAVKERINGAESITLSSMTEILKEIFQDAREQQCKKLLLVGSEGQILLKQKESVIKTYRVQQNGTFVERHHGIDDRLAYSVLNSLYGEEIAAQFPPRSTESTESNAVDVYHRSECSSQSEIDSTSDSDGIYSYKVAGTYYGYGHPENHMEINEACVAYAGAQEPEIDQPASEPVASALPSNPLSVHPLPLMLMANSIQLEDHMPAANDRYIDPDRHDEDLPVNGQKSAEGRSDIERHRQHVEVEIQALQIIKDQLQKCVNADQNGEASHYLRYIESCIEKREAVADAYNEIKESPEENRLARQTTLVELTGSLTPIDEVQRVVDKYFSEHQLITIPRTERPGFVLTGYRPNTNKDDAVDPNMEPRIEKLVSATVQDSGAVDIKVPSRHANALNPTHLLPGTDIKRNRSSLSRRALSSPVTSPAMASSIEPSEIIGSIEFQKMLEMFESLNPSQKPHN